MLIVSLWFSTRLSSQNHVFDRFSQLIIAFLLSSSSDLELSSFKSRFRPGIKLFKSRFIWIPGLKQTNWEAEIQVYFNKSKIWLKLRTCSIVYVNRDSRNWEISRIFLLNQLYQAYGLIFVQKGAVFLTSTVYACRIPFFACFQKYPILTLVWFLILVQLFG